MRRWATAARMNPSNTVCPSESNGFFIPTSFCNCAVKHAHHSDRPMPRQSPRSSGSLQRRMVPISPLADSLRRYDRDRYLAALFVPADRRAAVIALYAFNHEIAKTREVVSEPLLGRIRLQWWREAIEEAYGGGGVRAHEVMTPLAAAIREHRLTREHLDAMIDAR